MRGSHTALRAKTLHTLRPGHYAPQRRMHHEPVREKGGGKLPLATLARQTVPAGGLGRVGGGSSLRHTKAPRGAFENHLIRFLLTAHVLGQETRPYLHAVAAALLLPSALRRSCGVAGPRCEAELTVFGVTLIWGNKRQNSTGRSGHLFSSDPEYHTESHTYSS